MNIKKVAYYIQVKGLRFFDRFTVPSTESDEAFLDAYPRLVTELKERLRSVNPDCESFEYRAIKSIQNTTTTTTTTYEVII